MDKLRETILQALGEASMCWSETPKGIFDDTRAIQIGEELLKVVQGHKATTLNNAYAERNLCVALIADYAQWVGHGVWMKIDPNEEAGWQHIIFIDLPTGQVSWHLQDSELENFPGIPEWPIEWDGHTTEEKYKRIQKFIHRNE
jgi:hypothetical protein